jgi:molybdate transport system substrate-binding protein
MFTRRGLGVRFAAMVGGLAAVLALGLPAARADSDVVVFAAASLKNALDAVDAAWKAEGGKSATASYAASSALAKQIEGGAPADVFISADLDWMKYLSEKKLIKDGHRR